MNSANAIRYQLEPVYVVCDAERLIARERADCWTHVLDYTSWQDYRSRETIAGTPGEIGEVVRLEMGEAGMESFPPYLAKTICIEAQRQIVWKTFSIQGEAESEFFGIVNFRLNDAPAAQTRFAASVYYEYRLEWPNAAARAQFAHDRKAELVTLMATLLERFSSRVASR
jgi:hypothetical protein